MKHKDKTKCIICLKPLSEDELKSYSAMGNENCKCWKAWMSEMESTEHSGKSQLVRDKRATKTIIERCTA